MRTFAFFGAAAIAASLFAAGNALAWTEEKPSQQQDQNSVTFSDPETFKVLQDKVNGKSQSESNFFITDGKSQSQSGFYFSGGVNYGDSSTMRTNPYRLQPMTGSGSAFSFSPNPGFRGDPQ
jgi:hypothetical protein